MKDNKYVYSSHGTSWRVQIPTSGGKYAYLGCYKTMLEAINVRNNYIKELESKGIFYNKYSSYTDKIELEKEILISKAMGRLSRKGFDILNTMVININRKFRYKYPDDREDVMGYSRLILLQNWYNYDELVYDNPFAYYTEIIKRAHAFEFNRLNKDRVGVISYDSSIDGGRPISHYI